MRIIEAHAAAMRQGSLPVFTLFDHPLDMPTHYVVRMFLTSPSGTQITTAVCTYERLDDARASLEEAGLLCMPRDEKDDPKIVESWL